MNKLTKTLVSFVLLGLLFVFSCQKKQNNKQDTIVEGKATIYVDESIFPIVEDEQVVFETEYKAKLNLISKPENEIVNSLLKDNAKIAVLTRRLSDSELKAFQSQKRFPRITPFATDAIAFIKNKTTNDTLVALQDIIDFIKGKKVSTINWICS